MFNPLLEGLATRNTQNADGVALVDCKTGRNVTVAELWIGANVAARYFTELGIKPGDNVVVTTHINERYCKLIYALFMVGAIPVFLDPGMPKKSLTECLNELSPKLWISDQRPINEHVQNAAEIPCEPSPSVKEAKVKLREMGPDDPVLMIYTTGTTGIPKGVPWTCCNIASHLDAQSRQYGEKIETEFILFAHLGISAIATGRCAILPDLDSLQPNSIDIENAVKQMQKYGCDYTFASPSYWKRLEAYCSIAGIKVENAKVVSTAGASVNVGTLEQVSLVLPNAEIFVPYASTEVLMPISVISLSELSVLTRSGTALGKGVPIGRPVDDMKVEVIDQETNPENFDEKSLLKKGRIGELIVFGPRVTKSYFKRPEVQADSKLIDKNGGVWHRMGDIGYIDNTGMIWFLCRKKHVRISQEKWIYPDQQEQSYNYHLKIDECAVISPSGFNSIFLVAPYQLQGSLNIADINRVAELCGFKKPEVKFYPSILPTDTRHNSKINRELIEEWLTSNIKKDVIEGAEQ